MQCNNDDLGNVTSGENATTLAHLPPFFNLDTYIRQVLKYKTAVCQIPKNMSTVITAIFCFLYDSQSFRRSNRTIGTELFFGRFCEHKNEHLSVGSLVQETNTTLNEWIMLLIVRDPLDRFISGFLDKCVLNTIGKNIKDNCYGCGKDIACVLKMLYDHALLFVTTPEEERRNVINIEDYHFFPQNWFCSMGQHKSNYKILKYQSDKAGKAATLQEIFNIFKERNVPQDEITAVMSQTAVYNNHTTVNTYDREFYHDIITSRSDLLQLVHKIYYHDYELFGYEFNYTDIREEMLRRPSKKQDC
ncbi:hypothetical protein QR680_016046 [Steinernema hermaphroditum]|uniref:Sulfotransferase domain-containing protein n=1 Tax=Steinernema hermaphroditum TaxID=289476 RepID=A0AA39LLS4_9BILA|nr:hypothetical protein QR680_016046 [Steinernema hermaphroditum]